jgi:hypothetical protein
MHGRIKRFRGNISRKDCIIWPPQRHKVHSNIILKRVLEK